MAQQQLKIMGAISTQVVDLPSDWVASCDTEQAAFRLCIANHPAKLHQGDIAELLGESRANLNTILNSDYNKRKRTLSRVKQIELQKICQNRAIDQWADLYAKGMLNCQRTVTDRKAELLAELAELAELEAQTA